MKFRPQFNLKFRSAEEFVAVKEKACVEDISVNEWVLRQMESAAGWEPGKWDGEAKKAGAEQKISSVARGVDKAHNIVVLPESFGEVVGAGDNPQFTKLDEFFSKPAGVMVDGVVERTHNSAEGAELNSGDALAGLGIRSPVAPVYGGVERHNTSTCRIHKCLMCEAIKGEKK